MHAQLILDAEHGIGIIKFAWHAPMVGFSTAKKSAHPFQINAPVMTTMETVSHAIKDMI
jgi:hypothetical protein